MKSLSIFNGIITFTAILLSNLSCLSQNSSIILSAIQNNSNIPNTGICENTSKVTLTLDNVDANSKFTWTGPSKFSSSIQNPEIETNLSSNGVYNVNITNTVNTNILTASIKIIINPKPSKIKTDFNIAGKIVTLIGLSENPNYNYSWKSPQGMTSTSKIFENENTQIDELGVYKLIVTDPTNGCTSESSTDITRNKVEKVKIEPFGRNTEEEDNASFDYYFLKDCPMYQCDLVGNILSNDIIPIPWSSTRSSPKFTLLTEIGDFMIIKFWNWKSIELQTKYNKNSNGQPLFFKISKQDLSNNTRKHFSIWFQKGASHISAGTVIIPLKLRFNDFDFSKDVTLGPFVGFRTRMHQTQPSFISLGLNVGITSVSLNGGNTKKDGIAIKENFDVAAFTWALGAVFEFQKVQIGVFWGHDNISKTTGYDWSYQNKGWLSVGFGYSILSTPSNSKGATGGTNH